MSGEAEGHGACAGVGAGRVPGLVRVREYIQRQEEILILGSRLTFQAFRRLGILEKRNVVLEKFLFKNASGNIIWLPRRILTLLRIV